MPDRPPADPQSLPLAERGARLIAASIDELLLLAIALPMIVGALPALTALVVGNNADPESLPLTLDSGDLLRTLTHGPGTSLTVIALIVWSVVTAWLVAANGQSIGKRIVGIKVVRSDGSRASFARIFLLRNVVAGLPAMVLPTLGLLYQLIDPLFIYQQSRKCLHDMIAGTAVVRVNTGGYFPQPRE